LRDYGNDGQIGLEDTPDAYVARMVAVFREVRRVLRDDGSVWLNLGDSYCNAGSCRNGEGLDGRRRGGATGANGSLGYKLRDKRHSLRASGIKHKDLVGIPWRVALALQADGWYLRSDIIWHKPNPMPESVTDRPTKAHEYLFLLTKSARYFYDADAVKVAASRAPQTWQGDAERRSAEAVGPMARGADGFNHQWQRDGRVWASDGKRNRRSVWTIPTRPFNGAHFAVMPPALVEPCILAGCPEGGTVLDPFGGSGTVAVVALQHHRQAIVCELNPEYAEIARQRIASEGRPAMRGKIPRPKKHDDRQESLL